MPFNFLYTLFITFILNGCVEKKSFEELKEKIKRVQEDLNQSITNIKDKNITVKNLNNLDNNLTSKKEDIEEKIAEDENLTKKLAKLEQILQKEKIPKIYQDETKEDKTSLNNSNKKIDNFQKQKESKINQKDKNSDNIENDLVNKEKEPIVKNIDEDIVLKDLHNHNIKVKFKGERVIFEKYKNKVVIIEVFTTWCPNCLKSFVYLDKLSSKYRNKVKVIGILLEKGRRNSEILKFKDKHHIKYTITNGEANFKLIQKWGGVSGYPTIIIFDKSGNYFNHYNGLPPYEMLKSDIKKVIRK